MPRYEYRAIGPTPAAEKAFLTWIDRLDQEFMSRDPEHRSLVVRDTLHQLYLGHRYSAPDAAGPLAAQSLAHTFDPRNATLEPEYYANVYSHAHDLNDGMIVSNHKTEIGPKARITYHATVLSGVKVGEHGMLGSMGVASKNVDPFTVVAGIPAKPVKVKTIAPEELRKAMQKQ